MHAHSISEGDQVPPREATTCMEIPLFVPEFVFPSYPTSLPSSLPIYPKTIAPATRATKPTALPPILAAPPVLFGAIAGVVVGPAGEVAGLVRVAVSNEVIVMLEFDE